MSANLHLWLIPLLPLAGFLVNGLAGRRLPKTVVTAVALLASLGSFGVVVLKSLALAGNLKSPLVESCPNPWIHAGAVSIDFSFVFDSLTMVMLLVVTGVGFLIHAYSAGYMHEDAGYARFFSYLNLFLFFMTVLVLAGNALVMFVGWEGVGLASYLLIGFWFQKKSAADAGKKAFIVNRVGDFGFLLGIFLLLANLGTLTFAEIGTRLNGTPNWQGGVLTMIALCLLLGAAGKSAQLPLYVWLPDAMEGPTPVSALIHAATMVTAGVYMIARLHVLFDHSLLALNVVAIVGGATALFAATIALVQNDIKRVLAYSTISQLGYMFLACGVASYSAGVFHLMTHAFFKALLFLAAGAVIHAIGGEQDMRQMGGLWKRMPLTFAVTTVGVLAIAGFPPLAGFFSKDAILEAAFARGQMGAVLGCMGLLTALLTSFYMFRMWYLTFFGQPRGGHDHPHGVPFSMAAPLLLLALLSVVGGWIGIERLSALLAPAVGEHLHQAAGIPPATLAGIAGLLALLGWLVADRLYRSNPAQPGKIAAAIPAGYKLLANKYYVDEIYSALLVKPLMMMSKFVLEWIVDTAIIGGVVWLIAIVARIVGGLLQYWQSGNLRSYAGWLAAAAAAVLLFVMLAGGHIPVAQATDYLHTILGGR